MSDFHSDCKRQLLTAADALFGVPHASPTRKVRGRRRLPVLTVIAISALLLAAAAFAADRIIGVGAPVRPSNGSTGSSRSTGIGLPVVGSRGTHRSASLLPISVPDPAGGLPWGMRIVTTTRGALCVQVGRLLDGHLGVLGGGGLFKDDGLFHELPLGALEQSMCSRPNVVALYRGSGASVAGALSGEALSCSLPGSPRTAPPGAPSCATSDEQILAFGLLGSHAVSVSYKIANRLRTVATSGSHGAYLFALAQPPGKTPVNGNFMAANIVPTEQLPVAALQGYLLSTVVFRSGDSDCQTGPEHLSGGPAACISSTTAAPAISSPTASDRGSHVTLIARKTAHGYALDLSFMAPVAVHDAGTAYAAEYTLRGVRPCESGNVGQPIERDVRRGQRVHATMLVSQKPGCHGVIHGQIVLGRQSSPLVGPTYDERTIGRFTYELP